MLFVLLSGLTLNAQSKSENCTVLRIHDTDKKTFQLIESMLRADDHNIQVIVRPGYIETSKTRTIPFTLQPDDGGWIIKTGKEFRYHTRIWFELESEELTLIYIRIQQTSRDIRDNVVIEESKKEGRSIAKEDEFVRLVEERCGELQIAVKVD